MPGAQELAYMRGTVIRAHATPSPRRIMETVRYTDERYGERKPPPGPLRWEAEMRRASTRVVGHQTRPRPTSNMPLPPWAFDDAALVAAIRGLPPIYQHWLRYAYADSREWADEQGVTVTLWQRFEPTITGAREKTRKACKGLAHLAVQEHKARKNSGRSVHEPATIRDRLQMTEANWDKHWRPKWQTLHRLLDGLDREALTALWRITE